MHMKQGQMPRADKFNGTIGSRASHDESGELSRESALGENAVSVFHHAIARETGFGEAAKRCMEVTHEHRRSNTLAGNIPQPKEQAEVRLEQISVITPYHGDALTFI